ncbi:hypothetical protein LD110_22145, partial [Arthrobacter sp. M4]|nr:hypothetical protein [Arthrobacter sp. M4]
MHSGHRRAGALRPCAGMVLHRHGKRRLGLLDGPGYCPGVAGNLSGVLIVVGNLSGVLVVAGNLSGVLVVAGNVSAALILAGNVSAALILAGNVS